MNKIAMIPAAGRGSRMLSLTENNPKAMLPFNNKPIIGHHLDYLIEEGFKEVVIIVGYQKEKLVNYTNQFYGDKINIRFAEQKELNGLAGAIYEGIQVLNDFEVANSTLLILLGDIVLTKKLKKYNYDYIGYDFVDDWSRWCLMEESAGYIVKFIDKPDEKPNTNKAVMGVYNITEIDTFEAALEQMMSEGQKIKNEFQLSQALDLYLDFSSSNIEARLIRDYYDLGELDALNKTRKNITRHFNSITPTEDNTIIKSSSNVKKIQKEIEWFNELPKQLSLYTPHLVDFDAKEGIYELEFIHSSPIQELYLFNLPEKYQWVKIFEAISKFINKSMEIAPATNIDEDNLKILIGKTFDRVELLKKYDFVKDDFITINNIVYKNPLKHMPKLYKIIADNLCSNTKRYFSHLHGDLFFGNMLYDVNTNVLKVIDPRGEYGTYTNYGDIRYDIAKLNHSVNGYYDFIVNGLYFLEEKDNKYFYHFYESKQDEVKQVFNEIILSQFNIKEIKLLTGLLFLTMIPLHSENPKNQKMQFIRAVEFLNEFI